MSAAEELSVSLREEVQELRKRGEALGLNREQIDDAILTVLGEKKGSPLYEQVKKQHQHGQTRWWQALYLILFSATLLIAAGGLCNYNQQCSRYALQAMADLSYPVVRVVRFMVLPIHRFHDISFMNKWDCVVDNPFFSQEKPECAICEDVVKCPIHPTANLTKRWFKRKYYDTGNPVVVRNVPGYVDQNHSYEELQQVFYDNEHDLGEDTCEFYAGQGQNESTFESLQELMVNWEHYRADGKVTGWKLCYGKGMRAVRERYPRPYFIQSEGALFKSLFLLQPAGESTNSQVVQMPNAFFDNAWLAQAAGSTQVDLAPVEECTDQCKHFTRTLIKGDVLFYTQHMWTVSFKNVQSEPAILFSSSCA